MRRLLLALPFALLPLAALAAEHSHEHDHGRAHAEHGSLDAHEHGAAQLNVVLDGKALELQLESPAMNLVGFEHAAKSAADKAKVAAARSQLEQPQALFGLAAGDCSVNKQELESPLFTEHGHEEHKHDDHHEHAKDSEHSDIHVHYSLDCQKPEALKQLNLGELFKRFPATEKIQVQLIGPNGQQGLELTPAQPTLSF
ncbi:DUF2796 domain-containing protein [Pseudomonas sp. HMWF032]|uniref:DUF2796 domain-containing protein n=1 Tax=unclassified Pseudomonas TaxID=196821 RepID=UPI000D3867B1|nr:MULTISPECIES: DUF2796 domain-containing protein [unclassified Pseudomonas]PTS85992.1 DUF2796 domain-containing protein [Pseudomonas sp. HMWF032]PTT79543.1 DUF2796 domain-containing protein [Pseudomonas sp. HMWF010]WAC45470.1 DUF2796 domain-containing protein [Pseudomonas sp. SL4(2022)]